MPRPNATQADIGADVIATLAHYQVLTPRQLRRALELTGLTSGQWVLFVEVKTGSGELEPEQRAWRDVICDVEERPDSRVVWVLARPRVFRLVERFLETTDPTVLTTAQEAAA